MQINRLHNYTEVLLFSTPRLAGAVNCVGVRFILSPHGPLVKSDIRKFIIIGCRDGLITCSEMLININLYSC